MADGEFIVKLDPDTADRLKAAADAAGQTVSDYASALIADGLDDDWAEDFAALEEYDRTGVSHSVEEGMAAFDAAMKVQLGKTR